MKRCLISAGTVTGNFVKLKWAHPIVMDDRKSSSCLFSIKVNTPILFVDHIFWAHWKNAESELNAFCVCVCCLLCHLYWHNALIWTHFVVHVVSCLRWHILPSFYLQTGHVYKFVLILFKWNAILFGFRWILVIQCIIA